MNNGYFRIDREAIELLFDDPVALRLYIHIKRKALFIDGIKKGETFIGRGEYLRSLRKLPIDLKYKDGKKIIIPPKTTIERRIIKLVKLGLIKKRNVFDGTLYTITDSEYYERISAKNKRNNDNNMEIKKATGTLTGTDAGHMWDRCGTIINKEVINDINKERERNVNTHTFSKIKTAKENEYEIKELWLNTWGRIPNPPEEIKTIELIKVYGIEHVEKLMQESALKNFRNFQNFLDSIDENGAIKPLKIKDVDYTKNKIDGKRCVVCESKATFTRDNIGFCSVEHQEKYQKLYEANGFCKPTIKQLREVI